MKNSISLLAAITLTLFTVTAYGAGKFRAPASSDCDGSTNEIFQCLIKKTAEQDKILNDAYKAYMNNAGESQAQKKLLKDAQVAWIKFRDADCGWQRDMFGAGGTMNKNIQAGCVYSLTEERAALLKEAAGLTTNAE